MTPLRARAHRLGGQILESGDVRYRVVTDVAQHERAAVGLLESEDRVGDTAGTSLGPARGSGARDARFPLRPGPSSVAAVYPSSTSTSSRASAMTPWPSGVG